LTDIILPSCRDLFSQNPALFEDAGFALHELTSAAKKVQEIVDER
jgi:hypothetical protein